MKMIYHIVDIKSDTPSSAAHPTIFAQLSFEVPELQQHSSVSLSLTPDNSKIIDKHNVGDDM
jgi:hypothetical protein